MIDPFPNQLKYKVKESTSKSDILTILGGLAGALLNQGRFKAEDIYLASKPDVFSRFIILPKKNKFKYSIACGYLGGFSGFISEKFRIHDYDLGRRNCQRFLDCQFGVELD